MKKGSHWRSGILRSALGHVLFSTLLASVVSFVHAQNITSTDDAKQSIAFTKPAQRIITLAPSLTELAFAAGAGDKVVAVSAYSDYPLIAKKLPQVSNASGVSFESLLALKPDLVLAWKSGNRASDLQRIRDFGIPVFAIEIERMNDVPRALRNIGLLAATSQISERAAAEFEQRIDALRADNTAKSKVSVFFEISREPLMSVNRNHAISEIIRLCGGENSFADMAPLVFVTPLEALFSKQPDAIIYTSSDASEKMLSPRYRGLRASDAKRIYRIPADPILRTGPRMAEGAANVCASLDQARQSITATK
jgi:iron complex transport system substrate-binding protein